MDGKTKKLYVNPYLAVGISLIIAGIFLAFGVIRGSDRKQQIAACPHTNSYALQVYDQDGSCQNKRK